MIEFPSYDERLQNMLDRMVATTPFNAVSPGSIARTLLEIINSELQRCYTILDNNMAQCFLSTATGIYLDKLGEVVGCKRLPGEPDGNYRYRISNQCFSNAKANETAVRLACLSVKGVYDVKIIKMSHGIGSFSVFITSEDEIPSQSLIDQVQATIDSNQALGIGGKAIAQTPKRVALVVYVSLANNATASDALKNSVTAKIKTFVDGLPTGGVLYPSDIISQITSSNYVQSAAISSLKINGEKQATVSAVNAKWYEKIIVDSIDYLVR